MRRAFFMRYSFPKKEHLTKKEHFDGPIRKVVG